MYSVGVPLRLKRIIWLKHIHMRLTPGKPAKNRFAGYDWISHLRERRTCCLTSPVSPALAAQPFEGSEVISDT